MKNTYLSLLPIILVLLIFQSGALAKDTWQSARTDVLYILLDQERFNDYLLTARAKGEAWTFDPVMVSLRFTDPFEGLTQNIERVNRSAESPETTTITITNEGLLDDSVMREKFFLKLKRTEHGVWLITSAGKLVKCREGRGHQDYSNKPCN